MNPLPDRTRVIIIGAGFAGAAAAWALGQTDLGPGIIVEREPTPGVHASGRNAALVRVVETDPVMRTLALRSVAHIRRLADGHGELIRSTGSLTLAGRGNLRRLEAAHAALRQARIASELLPLRDARQRFAFLERMQFEAALWCPADGIADIHALLMTYLEQAKAKNFELHAGCGADRLLIEGSRVVGVAIGDAEIRADVVVDATGAWAGLLTRERSPLPLQPFRRHLYVSGPLTYVGRSWPYVWLMDGEAYLRPEGDGLLLSPCDETPWPPGAPPTDPTTAILLAEKLSRCAPGLADLTLRQSWACLRTFAPDRRPVIGPDPVLQGLYHVSGLGGSGMTASAAIGELVAAAIAGTRPDWLDPATVVPARFSVPGDARVQ
ncbi:MAG: FAD-binding oxidoreductase [Acidobacteria bacterium]|nr:FAD-binding oxidoreductase [Acidobacteriota bacterium]